MPTVDELSLIRRFVRWWSTVRYGRDLPSGFDPVEYLSLNPDVAKANVDPVRHFLKFGRKEGRSWRRVQSHSSADPHLDLDQSDAAFQPDIPWATGSLRPEAVLIESRGTTNEDESITPNGLSLQLTTPFPVTVPEALREYAKIVGPQKLLSVMLPHFRRSTVLEGLETLRNMTGQGQGRWVISPEKPVGERRTVTRRSD
jgi:hypothetical protein